uniref:Uncharacterized protein LOC111135993 isoform X1 n=2 Tax=Crassostrea virginica TaxID=6565 RepID=A0A8B8ER30_CRAVI|nr:uncharacterized protein LOC111135993 isoform X1 [Crassostrea virginica]
MVQITSMSALETTSSDCGQSPEAYKTCGQFRCVPVNVTCPCLSEEFNCADGTCISQVLVCNGVKDCDNGNDEIICKGALSTGVPLSVFIAVTCVCVLFCVLAVIVIYIRLRRRHQRTNASLASNALLQQSNEKDNTDSSSKNPPCSNGIDIRDDTKNHLHRSHGYEKVPQDFGIFFGEEFLGTSTPKQGIKHIINPKRFSGNVDFLDQVIVNQSLNSCGDFRGSSKKPPARKPRAIGDSASNLNTSLFLPIDHVTSTD